jgi:hypothetical protein
MNIFDEIQHRLASKTRIRTLFKDVHIDDIERIVSRLEGVLTEKKNAKNSAMSKVDNLALK